MDSYQTLKWRMNLQQAGPPRTSVNGFGRRTVETGGRVESKTHPMKAASSSFGNAGEQLIFYLF